MKDRVVAVAGGAGILGKAIVKQLAAKGAHVVVIDKASTAQIDGAQVIHGGIDLTDLDATSNAFSQTQEKFRRIDGLINVAGTFRWETLAQGDVSTWDLLFAINLKSVVVSCKAALPYLLETKGAIVNIGANAGQKGSVGMGAYSASKAGVARLTESLAEELKNDGVRVNAILPSIIDTPQNRIDIPDADFASWVRPSEIAEVVAFLISSLASGVTGACIPVVGRV